MVWKDLTVEELKVYINGQPTGCPLDQTLPNFWIKQYKSLHKSMAESYSVIIQNPKKTPDLLVEGTTNILPKKEETWISMNYRPIACLSTTLKILTSVITDRLHNHLEKESIMTPEQRGEGLQWM